MKKLLALLLILVVVCVSGCNGQKTGTTPAAINDEKATTGANATAAIISSGESTSDISSDIDSISNANKNIETEDTSMMPISATDLETD